MTTYEPASYEVDIGLWQKVNGTWSRVTTVACYVTTLAQAGLQTMNWYLNETVQLASGVTDFGITLEGSSGINPQITAFNTVSWQTSSASGVRSATPGNQQTSVIVRPV